MGGGDVVDAVYVLSVSNWRGAAVVGIFGVEEPGYREGAARWGSEDGEELAGSTTSKQIVLDIVLGDVVLFPPVLRIVVE